MAEQTETGGSRLGNVLKYKQDLNKTPEQLEAEKQETLAKRVVKLQIDGLRKDALAEMAQKLYEILTSLHSNYYDLSAKGDRQKYEMMELAERGRQLERGKTKKAKGIAVGLGGSVFDKLQEHFPQAPPKISLFSRYERVTDRRSLKERRDVFALAKDERPAEKPKKVIKELQNSAKKPKRDRKRFEVKTRRGRQEQRAEEAAAAAAEEAQAAEDAAAVAAAEEEVAEAVEEVEE